MRELLEEYAGFLCEAIILSLFIKEAVFILKWLFS